MRKTVIITLILISSFIHTETYTIKKGDTLYSISKKFNITLENLMEWNNINSANSLSIGMALIVGKGNYYTVEKGDTLYSISKKLNFPLSEILEFNNLEEGSIISLGQVIYYPGEGVQVIPEIETMEEDLHDSVDVTPESGTIAPFWPVEGNRKSYNGRIKGIEIIGRPGDYIRAVSNGKVIWYDSYKGIGKVVLIEGDNGYDYLYGTNEALNVSLGNTIARGDRLGRLQENNTSLIFSVFKNGKPLENISNAPR